ncbi:pyrimidine utilization protein A [Acidisphaera sp. L21]|uniref:pyrimidine utilization protein A n=1 Tax=Acidisphaera sp. L21 TaxID=1641851 RepID=UPI00131AA64B|nr:pyrimidine utilization protein A [Acidisphaera sp. L21]
MIKIGVFIPIGSRGWLISTTSPKTMPSFDLNRTVVQRAEHYGMDFALAMIKLRGFGGPSEYWDHNLEAFTLMAGIAAVTHRIQLFASVAVLTMPPALTARMASTIDSIAPGRIGVNIVTGWQPKEYQQMGLWPGEQHFARRYDYVSEYVTIMRDLMDTGRSDFKGEFFQMDDCRLSPQPSQRVEIVGANSSDRGMRFVAEHCDYNFVGSGGLNEPERVTEPVGRLMTAVAKTGRDVGAFALMMVIADVTDEAAFAKWDRYKDGTDLEALAWQYTQATADVNAPANSTVARMTANQKTPQPTGMLKLIGSYASVAAMLDQVAEIPGLKGIMLTFDDFIIGMEQFGQYIQPLMKSRTKLSAVA